MSERSRRSCRRVADDGLVAPVTRLPASWWGWPVAAADDGEVHLLVPSARSARRCRGTPRPRCGPRGGSRRRPAGRPPGRRPPPPGEGVHLGGSFTARRGDVTCDDGSHQHPGRASWRRRTNVAHVRSEMAIRCRRRPRARPRTRSGPPTPPRPGCRTGRGGADPRLRGGGRRACVAVARQDEHGEPLEGHRLVPGQPRQVGPEREQEDVASSSAIRGADPIGPGREGRVVHRSRVRRGGSDTRFGERQPGGEANR